MSALVAGVDIGGTKTAVGLVDRNGTVHDRAWAETPSAGGSVAILDTASTLVHKLAAPAGLAAVGAGSAGVIDPVGGVVRSATRALPGWAGTDLRGELANRLDVPVAVDNDVHAHGLGEHWLGASSGFHTALSITVGTGIGGSLIIDGAVRHGAHHVAGHIGHLAVAAAEQRCCPCGARGHLEAIASGPALLAEYGSRTGRTPASLADVAAAAVRGEASARAVLAEGGAAVGTVLGGAVNLLDPDVVVLGGGVTDGGETWWDALRSAATAQLLPTLGGIPIVPAALGSDAAIVGAARMAWEVTR